MNRLAFLCAAWIVAINLIAPLARSAATGGIVLGPAERPVEGAIVQLIARDGRVLQETRSDQSGRFTLDAPPEATWLQVRTDELVSSPRALGGEGPGVELVVRLGDEFQSAQAAVDRKIESLRERLFEMQAELTALVESQAAGRAAPSPNELTVAAPQRSSSDSLYRYPAGKGPQAEAPQGDSSLPASLPGRAYGNKGLNQGLAAGAPGRRYGRAVYSDFLRIGGYGSFRYENNNIALGPQVADLPRLKRGHDAFDFRRFVFTMDAAPHKRLRFYTEIEFERLNQIEVERTAIPENRGRATRNRPGVRFIQEVEGTSGGEIAVEQAWMQYSFSDEFSARVGVILPPVGRYNILHDDDYWDIARRPLAVTGGPVTPVKSAWREMGAGLLFSKPVGRGYVEGQFYFVNGVQLDFALETVAALREGRNLIEVEPEISFSSGAFDGSQDADAATWRMAVSPRIGHEIAVSGYHGRYTPDYLKQQAWVNTLALDGKSTIGRFEVEGEYIHTKFNRHQEVLNDIALQFVDSAAATSSAETSTLETEIEAGFKGPFTRSRAGFWLDLKYRLTPEWLRRGMLGRDFEDPQLIPVFRWERIYFNDFVRGFDFAGGAVTNIDRENAAQERFTLGLSYRPVPSVVLSGAWEHNRRLSGSALLFPTRPGTDPIPSKSYNGLIIGAAFGF